jgi:hypothetical protein
MASNVKDFKISKTFANVILSNVESDPDMDGIPFDLSTSLDLERGRLQDGLGVPSPLYLSRTVVEVDATPVTDNSLIRKKEIMEGIAFFQTQSLIFS